MHLYNLCAELIKDSPALGISFSVFLLFIAANALVGAGAILYAFYRTFVSGKPQSEAERSSGANLSRFFGYVFSVLFFCFALITFDNIREAAASRSWPSVEGVISRVWIEEAPGRGAPRYFTRINYSYTVNGRPYYSDRIDAANNTLYASRQEAEYVVARSHPAGARVPVYYNPAHPEKAVLENGKAPNLFWLFFTLFCSYLLWPGKKTLIVRIVDLVNAATRTKTERNLRAFLKSEDDISKKE